MSEPATIYKPDDPDTARYHRISSRLGGEVAFKHTWPDFDGDPWCGWCIKGGYGIGTTAVHTQDGDWLGEDDTLTPVRVHRDRSGRVFIETGEKRVPVAGEWVFWRGVAVPARPNWIATARILQPAVYADEVMVNV